ncbi:hypothetical protein COLO4_36865 [Corchorus olitorius]|uniref:Uncharacterized protein n=1 Tax=Corchorus olitorius TaxID=93759 RepID=A0A1R3G4Q3_9ROSI|nr:hypothetical protein COLO4_36865 [Corchorus olitorius]
MKIMRERFWSEKKGCVCVYSGIKEGDFCFSSSVREPGGFSLELEREMEC